jgi:hypothetical protein
MQRIPASFSVSIPYGTATLVGAAAGLALAWVMSGKKE